MGTRYRKQFSLWLFILGMVCLGYMAGAAAMFFDLPTSEFLQKAFGGGRAWLDRQQALSRPPTGIVRPARLSEIDRPGKTFDGFTLYACAPGCEALLIDMRREVVHRWAVSFGQVCWRHPPVRRPVSDAFTCFFGLYLYPNGDLLAVFHGDGSGLVKLDQESNVLWSYPAMVHHDVDVGEDGTIYALVRERLDELPSGLEPLPILPSGLEPIPIPCLVDYVVLLSPDGKLMKKLSILEALRNSPYSILLSSTREKRLDVGGDAPELFHTNFVNVLSRELAPKFPAFKAGQVLISIRQLDTIAVLDPESGKVVWAALGPWKAQHSPQFLDNGHLLIFDNLGLANVSRTLEYDPQTQSFPWSYSGENCAPFLTKERGMSQRLPNGNTLIVNSDGGVFFEVSQTKEVVWSCPVDRNVTMARQYSSDELPFLNAGQRPR